MSSYKKTIYRIRFLAALLTSFIAISAGAMLGSAYDTSLQILTPPDYLTFRPPSVGGSYTDPVFGTAIKRISDAMHTVSVTNGGMVNAISHEYATMSPFNIDNTRLILGHFSYLALYDGAGNFLKSLFPGNVTEPRWSKTDPNVFYFISGNRLMQWNVGTDAQTVVHAFTEYSSITGKGESDISYDGNHFALAGDNRYVFVYEISTDTKGPVLDAGSGKFDSLYITAKNNVIVGYYTTGSNRFNGFEVYDRNMVFLRQLTHALGHQDVTVDTNGDELLVWANGADPNPVITCPVGIVKVRIADGKQTCIWKGPSDYSNAYHISAPDNAGWVIADTYNPIDVVPPNGWVAQTDEIVQIKLDGSEIRRLAHHRSRPLNSYTYQPKASVSFDGTKLVFTSNYGLQKQLNNPSQYTDEYLIDLSVVSPSSPGSGSGGSTGSGTPTPTPTPPSSGTPNPTPPPSGATTRVEQNASAVTYTGTWASNSGSFNSGSSAVLSGSAGSRATFAFNGTGATWIAYCDEWAGIANVYVDGVSVGSIDTYASPAHAKAAMYAATGLTAGNHTLAIEVTGNKGAASAGKWIWVDAFDVISSGTTTTPPSTSPSPAPAPAPAPPPESAPSASVSSSYHVEQTSPAVHWSGNWSVNNGTFNSGSSAKLAAGAGSQAAFTFIGTSVSWIGYRDEWSGIASVSIDGTVQATVDTYSSPAKAKTVVYTISGLSFGKHTIVIEATGTKSSSSRASWIWVDAFDYVGANLTSSLDSNPLPSVKSLISGGSVLKTSGAQQLLVGSAQLSATVGHEAPSGMALLSYRRNGVLVSEAGVPASVPVLRSRVFAEASGPVDTGVAVANPNSSDAKVSFSFSDVNGRVSNSGSLTIPAHGQIAKFVDEAPFNVSRPAAGTLTLSSTVPVSVIALRGLTNERGDFLLTTLPVAALDDLTTSTVYFPHFAAGGGWSTEFVLINPSDNPISGTLQLTGPLGRSIPYSIAGGGLQIVSETSTSSEVQVGGAYATPTMSQIAPVGIAIFSLKNAGVTVTEAGTASVTSSNAFRMYVESDSNALRSGVAIQNVGDTETQVQFELTYLDGTPSGQTASVVIPAFGQRAMFTSEIPGFQSLPSSFRGVLRVSSANSGDIAVMGIRGRPNERGDFLISALPATDEHAVGSSTIVFPHIVDGGGYRSEFITFSGTPSETSAGDFQLFSPDGTVMRWPLN